MKWFVRLRWLAGLSVVVGALVDWRWLNWSESPVGLIAIGVSILAYNAVLWALTRRPRHSPRMLLLMAGTQVLLDLAGLALICLGTGGTASPFISFFVFHMVFASLLLTTRLAYAVAATAALLMAAGLLLTARWPQERESLLRLGILLFTLLFTVHLANHLTRALRRQRRKLRRRNKRIHAMSDTLREHQEAMAQHEKMVALGHMAAGVTHEITNPLASMDSLLQLMLRNPQRMTAAKLETLRDQIQRINQIVQQMKTFARPVEMQCERVRLEDVVNQATQIFRFDPRLKRVRVQKEFAAGLPAMDLMPQAMEQVLVNLIHNAVDAMEGTAEPVLTLRTRSSPGYCSIDVIDNGHGIKPADLGRVFEPFFTTKPVGKGTGLGLSISYSLVQKQQGALSAHNMPGGGARFTVMLPVTADWKEDAANSRNREETASVISTTENGRGDPSLH